MSNTVIACVRLDHIGLVLKGNFNNGGTLCVQISCRGRNFPIMS